MSKPLPSALISTDALAQKLGQDNLRLLDASWHMPSEHRDARAEYAAAHLPGAVFFDIDAVSDRSSLYPHMLPAPGDFAVSVSSLGIGDGDEVVVYDASGIFSSPRVWWMLRVFGHENVRVLDGGLLKWRAEAKPLEAGDITPLPGDFTSHPNPQLLRNREMIEANITQKRELLLDARSPGRFAGTEPEPRPGLGSGHIPGSRNVFFKDCLSPPFNTLKTREELRALFAGKAIDFTKPIAATCGSGVTACILALALFELGNKEVAVYDGAWAEWGSQAAENVIALTK